jgi:hypothetical protein
MKHRCFIEIIKIQEEYISLSFGASRVETPKFINMLRIGQHGAIRISQPIESRPCNLCDLKWSLPR